MKTGRPKGHKLSEETKRKISNSMCSKGCWCKGLTKETDTRIKGISDKMKHPKPIEFKKKMSVVATKNYALGKKLPVGHSYGRAEWYTSPSAGRVYLRSSYESLVARWLDSRNIPWEYEKVTVVWTDEQGKQHTYYVDFHRLDLDGRYCIECKGYDSDNWKRKQEAFQKKFPHMFLRVVITQEDLNCFRNRRS